MLFAILCWISGHYPQLKKLLYPFVFQYGIEIFTGCLSHLYHYQCYLQKTLTSRSFLMFVSVSLKYRKLMFLASLILCFLLVLIFIDCYWVSFISISLPVKQHVQKKSPGYVQVRSPCSVLRLPWNSQSFNEGMQKCESLIHNRYCGLLKNEEWKSTTLNISAWHERYEKGRRQAL